LNRSNRGADRGESRGSRDAHRRRPRGVCKVCEQKIELTYKRPNELRRYVNRLGKILPRRASRLCAKHQRVAAREVKRSRVLALLPHGTADSGPPPGRRPRP
jgi:small subunit ribosomal protein S18